MSLGGPAADAISQAPSCVAHYTYTAFGQQYGETSAETVPQRYTFTGREAAGPAAAAGGAPMYYRYRMYSPSLGRFGRRDPKLGGDPLFNAYGFPGSDTVGFVDPDGLEKVEKAQSMRVVLTINEELRNKAGKGRQAYYGNFVLGTVEFTYNFTCEYDTTTGKSQFYTTEEQNKLNSGQQTTALWKPSPGDVKPNVNNNMSELLKEQFGEEFEIVGKSTEVGKGGEFSAAITASVTGNLGDTAVKPSFTVFRDETKRGRMVLDVRMQVVKNEPYTFGFKPGFTFGGKLEVGGKKVIDAEKKYTTTAMMWKGSKWAILYRAAIYIECCCLRKADSGEATGCWEAYKGAERGKHPRDKTIPAEGWTYVQGHEVPEQGNGRPSVTMDWDKGPGCGITGPYPQGMKKW